MSLSITRVEDIPHKADLGLSFRLFAQHWQKIVWGALIYILKHPIRAWPVLFARLYCVFAPYKGSIKTPEGFTLQGFYQFYVYGQIFIERMLYNKDMIWALKQQPCPRIVDVGANIGMFSQWLGLFNKNAFFYSFEPCPELQNELVRIAKSSPRKNALYDRAVGDYFGTAYLNYKGGLHLAKEGKPVRMDRLDNLLTELPIFLLKIDTDGSNLFVLEGAGSILGACRYVLIEKEADYTKYFSIGWKCTDLGNDLLYEQIKL